MEIRSALKILGVALITGSGMAANAMVTGGEGSLLVEGEMIKSVYGVFTYNERVNFSQPGTYSLSLSDLGFVDNFDFVGVMVSTTDKKIAEYTIEGGMASSTSPITFSATEDAYWVSVFAVTGSAYNGATMALNLQSVDVSEVPAPPAFVLMATSLLGLGSLVRRFRNRNKKVVV